MQWDIYYIKFMIGKQNGSKVEGKNVLEKSFLSIYQLFEHISFPIFHCIHISCSVTKVAHFGIIILQMIIFIPIYNSKTYLFSKFQNFN